MLNKIAVAVLVLFSLCAKAQDSTFASHFIALESNGSVLLSWIINQGNTCNGIDVYRSIDTPHFEFIGDIPGICGSGLEPQSFDFRDVNPIRNKTVFYQVRFGRTGYHSTTSILLLDLNKEGVQIRPNPTQGLTRVYFSNDNGRLFNLTLTSSTGTLIFSAQSTTTFFDLDLSGVDSGVYYYMVSEAGQKSGETKGKIVVTH